MSDEEMEAPFFEFREFVIERHRDGKSTDNIAMSINSSGLSFQERKKLVERHRDGKSTDNIAMSINPSGLSFQERKKLVERIIHDHENGIAPSIRPSFLDSHSYIKELVYFVGGIALVLIGSIILSLLLGVIAAIFKVIGLGGLGVFLVNMGKKVAGMLMGFLGTGASKETRSSGMSVGCWVGSGLYYWWLFSSMH